MAETYNKKEKEKKKAQRQKEKMLKREERKANNNKGKSLDEMMVYVDEKGNFCDTPPDKKEQISINLEDIQLGATPIDKSLDTCKGTVTFYNEEKGYGFVNDHRTNDNVFIHVNQTTVTLKQGDKISFEKERGPKGFVAINVIKIK